MKKLFAIFMIAMMLMCFMPSAAFADQISTNSAPMTSGVQIGNYYEVDDNTGELPKKPKLKGATQQSYEDGQVLVNKTITGTNTENVFDVNLEVITKDKIKQTEVSEDAAVVLVIDVSASMDEDGRIGKAKEAAQAFINSFADAESTAQRKIAIVKFSGLKDYKEYPNIDGATTVQVWADASDLTTLSGKTQCKALSDLEAEGGTNMAAGIQLAKNLLGMTDVNSITNKNIVILTDGEPTYGIGDGTENGTDTVCSNGSNMIGTGSTILGDDGNLYPWNNPDYHKIHVQTESISQSLGSSGITPYAVFIGDDTLHCIGDKTKTESYSEKEKGHDWKPGDEESSCNINGMKCSTWLATKCGFTTIPVNNINELTLAFERISKLIKLQAQAWQLTDPMGEYIDCIMEFTNDDMKDGISYDETTETLHWNIKLAEPNIVEGAYKYSFDYKIKLDNLAADFKPETLYPANEVTSLTYLITGSSNSTCGEPSLKTAYFNIPSVKGLAANLEFTKVDEDGNALAGAGFTLTANDNQNYKLTASSDETGKVIFADVPSGHDYTLEETTVPTGYEKADNATISVAFGVVSGITAGKIINQPVTTSVKVSKEWNDNNNQDGIRPGSITVQLLANRSVVEGESLVLNSGNGWKGSFENLPKFKAGEEIVYTVEEVKVDGYTSEITEDAQNGFVIKNSHTPETISVSGSKIWKDDNNKNDTRPTSITINLMANGVSVNSKKVEADGNGNWGWSFDNLPKYENGHEIQYSITEEAVTDYSTTYENNGNVVNTYTPGKTRVNVHKVWEDCDNQDGIRPQSVKVQLYANKEVVVGKELTLSKDNKWTGSFTDLSATDDDGAAISYSVKEVSFDSRYASTITGSATTMFTITNTHTPETTSISGSKTWNDDGNRDRKRPESITINLLADGVEIDEKIVKADNDGLWTYEFTNLPKYANGQLIKYTVTEDPVNDYIPDVDGYNLTNTYTPGSTSVAVTKVWNDGNDKDKIRPESVTVKLLINGNETDQTVLLSEGNQWSGMFTNLPINESGKPIKYSVKEVAVPNGYTAAVTGNAQTGFAITNTHTPKVDPPIGPNYTSVSVHKEWKLDDGGTAADSVTVQLYRNGVKYPGGEATLNKQNNWHHTWRPLYVYGDVWTVEEVNAPEGFTATVTKAAYSNDFTITNDDLKPEPVDPTQPEKPIKPENPAEPKNFDDETELTIPDTEVPKTGDTALPDMLIYTFLLALSALGGILVWHERKEKTENVN